MAKEIERKFLLHPEKLGEKGEGLKITQAYLSIDPERVVRVRVVGEQAYLTIKGASTGITRDEFEYTIPKADALDMMKLAIFSPIKKIRYKVPYSGKLWEIDHFLGANSGLWLAEVELKHENEKVQLPDWVGKEVSGDERFYNAYLAQFPFSTWE